jgi:hypothetical protein
MTTVGTAFDEVIVNPPTLRQLTRRILDFLRHRVTPPALAARP